MLRESQLVNAQVPQAITITIGPPAGNTSAGSLALPFFIWAKSCVAVPRQALTKGILPYPSEGAGVYGPHGIS